MSTENEPLRQVSARLDAVGHGTVAVDGQNLTDSLRGIEVRSIVGEVTQVALHVTPGRAVEYDGPAFVTVVQPSEPGGDLAAFAEWLGKVDPARLEEAALSRPDLTNDRHGLTRAVLATLAAWARGEE